MVQFILKQTVIILVFSMFTLAQQYTFPQNITYPYGYIPKTIDSDWLQSEYERWFSTALVTCNDTEAYVKTDTGGKVEAVGFGMLMFAYMGDRENFNRLYNFYKKNCHSNAGDMI